MGTKTRPPRLTLARSMPRGRREGRSARVGLPPPAVSAGHRAPARPCARPTYTVERAPCARHIYPAPRRRQANRAPAPAGLVTHECAGRGGGRRIGRRLRRGDGRVLGRGGGPPGRRRRRGLCPQGRGAPPWPGARSRPVRHASYAAARAAGMTCAAAGSATTCSRSMRSLSALSIRLSARARRPRSSVGTGSSRAPSSAMVRSASVRRVSIAMRALSPSARGSRVRSHSSAKRTVSR